MGCFKSIIICVLQTISSLPALAQVSSENYVQTSARISDTQMLSVTQYYDGLGRPTERVEHGVTPGRENLVHLQEFDGLGRDWRSWLPVKTSSSYLGRSDVASLSQSQYSDSHAYSAYVHDGSPLNRVVRVDGVGEDWSKHPVRTDFLINTTSFPLDCKYYRVSMQGELQDNGYYPEGRLKITKTTDEDEHECYEFVNLSDRVVLRRTMVSEKESADTYYIYDYRGNLRFVLPPNYQEEASLDKYAYQYRYDGRGNCIWKKLPLCEPIYMRYTRNNRLAFLQDGNLRKKGDWKFYVYDKLGRMVVSGVTSSASDVSDTYVYAQYMGTGSLDGYEVVGTMISPKSLLVTNFYDDYSFIDKCHSTEQSMLRLDANQSLESAFPSNAAPNARGYQTGKKVYLTDGSGRYSISSLFYGRKGRVVQSHTSNLLGGWEHHYTSYTYTGLPSKTVHVHTATDERTIQENYRYDYDHAARLVKTTYSINDSPEKVLSALDYDDLGRVFTQTLLDKESVAYLYNIRNWKTDILGQNFSQSLAYNHNNGSLIPRKSLRNGNISAMSWQVGNDVNKGYAFGYNSLGMLTSAEYGEGSGLYESNGNYDEYLSYDKMGNVLTLLRYGLRDGGQYGLIDNLNYGYNGSQLLKVDDSASGPYYAGAFHFVDGANDTVEYTYDGNGNMVSDLNKGICNIAYDINNQPREICFGDGRSSSYVYDAEGKKYSVSYNLTAMTSAQPLTPVMQSANAVSANATNGQKTISYCDNIIYDDGETIVLNDIGYAKYDKSGNLSFHYYLQDHLGNNRVVMNEDGTIEQVNDYYPTGALMGSSLNGEVQRYKYNGKELDRTHGLDWYDYGARNYDAALVRWRSLDILQEEHPEWSGYSYVYNNPLRMSDPTGQDGEDRIVGYVLGAVTNIVPFSGNLRDCYQPTDKSDYNSSLYQSDMMSRRVGNGLNKFGVWAIVVGTTATVTSTASLATTGGLSVEVSAPVAGAGMSLSKIGAAASAMGNLMMVNSRSNQSQGYDRGKKSNVSSGNKNSPHANQKRKTVNQDKYKQLKEEYDRVDKLSNKTPEIKLEKERLRRQLKRAQQRGDFKGENHSRNSKGNR